MLRNLEGLTKFAQTNVPGFVGPFVGKKVKPKPGGGAGPAPLPGCYSYIQGAQAGKAVVLGRRGQAYQSAIGGRS